MKKIITYPGFLLLHIDIFLFVLKKNRNVKILWEIQSRYILYLVKVLYQDILFEFHYRHHRWFIYTYIFHSREGNGNPLQCSFLQDSMDKKA